jgi:hypothetical protein
MGGGSRKKQTHSNRTRLDRFDSRDLGPLARYLGLGVSQDHRETTTEKETNGREDFLKKKKKALSLRDRYFHDRTRTLQGTQTDTTHSRSCLLLSLSLDRLRNELAFTRDYVHSLVS